MSAVTKPIALDETLQTTNTRINSTNTALGTLDTDLKSVAKDTTLQNINATLHDRVANDATLQTVKGSIDTVATNVSGVAKDTTLSATNTALGTLDTDLKAQTTGISNKLTTLDTDLKAQTTGISDKLTTLDTDLKAQTTKQTQDTENLLNGLIGALTSVKSINGKFGVVVLDSGDILISRATTGSKSVKQMLTEMETAIAKTPLSFSTSKITDTTDDYTLQIALGTPA